MRADIWINLSKDEKKSALSEILSAKSMDCKFSIDQNFIDSSCPRVLLEKEGIVIPLRVIFAHESWIGLSEQCRKRAEAISHPLQANIREPLKTPSALLIE